MPHAEEPRQVRLCTNRERASTMDFGTLVAITFAGIVAILIIGAVLESKRVAKMAPAEKQRYLAAKAANAQSAGLTRLHGDLKPIMLCPHCQEKGQVRTQPVTRKKGISGGKAVGAILTGGVSLLATGLSRKESTTEAFCGNCTCKWDF